MANEFDSFPDFDDFDFGENVDFDFDFDDDLKSSRYILPPRKKPISEKFLKYKHAVDLAKDIKLFRDCRYFILINGTFYFGDFLEAVIKLYNFHIKKLSISTLSLNQNNVDSLGNLIFDGYVEKLDLIVSDYFFAHERHKDGLIPYIYKELDKENFFQLAAARTHTKIAQFETYDGVFIVIHGSANLRTSDNIEQIVVEDNKELYKFNEVWHDSIIEKYQTIKKSVTGESLWQTINPEPEPKK